MKIDIATSPESAAQHAAEFVAAQIANAITLRGHASIAFSGGGTPALMFQRLTELSVDWPHVDIFQVDERIAPRGDASRNLSQLEIYLLKPAHIIEEHVHPMPVELADSDAAAREYEKTLKQFAGDPPVFDVVHLGMGADGHTASLVPSDPALDVADADVAISQTYHDKKRMTLTFPMLNRARTIVWLVCGADKAAPLAQMIAGDTKIPAGRIAPENAYLFTDSSMPRDIK